MKYKTTFTLRVFILAAILTACTAAPTGESTLPTSSSPPVNPESSSEATMPPATDQSSFLWQINILHAEMADNLANTQTFILYGGDTEDVQYTQTASPGHTFLLLKLSVDKNGTGGRPFSWSGVYVEDGAGNQYRRMDNDVFLEDYDLPRLKSTDLAIGGNTGYICLEIPADTDASGLKLIHETEDGLNVLPIPIG